MDPDITITQVPEQKVIKSSPSHLLLLFFVILGVAVLSALGMYYYLLPQLQYGQKYNIYPANDQSSIQQDTTQQVTPVSGDSQSVKGWKTYENDTYNFSLQYPSSLIMKVANDNTSQFLLTMTNQSEDYSISITLGDSPEFAKSTETYTANGNIWTIIPSANYCDAGNCGPTVKRYKIFKQQQCNKQNNPYNYNFPNLKCGVSYEFIPVKPSESTVTGILSTFKFTTPI